MIDDRLRTILADVLELEPGSITDATAAGEVKAWDSVRHLQLVLAVEGEFDVAFDPEEIPTLVSARAIHDALASRGVL
jgi:acyl carrier protein